MICVLLAALCIGLMLLERPESPSRERRREVNALAMASRKRERVKKPCRRYSRAGMGG